MGNLRESLPVVRQQSNGLCVRTSINRSLDNNDWITLGTRLTFKEAQLKEFDNGHEKNIRYSIRHVVSLETKGWLRIATYSVLKKALQCDKHVNRRSEI